MLQVRDLAVSFDRQPVLRSIDLEVAAGEAVAIIGPNGAGKTTLLRTLSGLSPSDHGTITFDGQDITHATPAHRVASGVVQISGGQALFPSMSVLENLLVGCHTFAWDRALVRRRITEAIRMFPTLESRLAQSAGSLSGGEQQMLSLAKGLVLQPRLLLVDELTLGLSTAAVRDLLAVIADLRARKVTMVLVEQAANLAASICDRGVLIERGHARTVALP